MGGGGLHSAEGHWGMREVRGTSTTVRKRQTRSHYLEVGRGFRHEEKLTGWFAHTHTWHFCKRKSIEVEPQTKFNYTNGLSHCRLPPRTQRSTNTVPTLKVCHGCGLDHMLSDKKTNTHIPFISLPFISSTSTAASTLNTCLFSPHHVCATVKRLCLWMLLLSNMRRSSRGELRGERRGEMEEGDRRCPRGLSGCSRFSRRIFTRSSFRPECFGMGGTARVSWWVTPMPACWAMPTPASPQKAPPPAKWMNSEGSQDKSEVMQ